MFHYFNLWHLAPAYVDQCKNFKNNSKKKKLSIYLLNLLSRKEKRTKQKKKKKQNKKKSLSMISMHKFTDLEVQLK